MAQWNQTDKTLQTKIVYWGTALGGKTTNLQQIHAITDPEGENRLISLNTSSDRTLFFDLLPLDLGRIFGHALKIQLYTVPGQVRYDATRRVVLSGADAVVFVADSQRGRGAENRAAWENLRANMKVNGLDPASTAVIVQYNKQDIQGCLPPKEVEACLQSGRQGIPASALHGAGVMETFHAAVLEMLRRLAAPSGRRRAEDLKALEEQIERTFERYRKVPAGGNEPLESRSSETDPARSQAGTAQSPKSAPAEARAQAGPPVPAGTRTAADAQTSADARADAGPSRTGGAPKAGGISPKTAGAERAGPYAGGTGMAPDPRAPSDGSTATAGARSQTPSPTTIRFSEDGQGEDLLVRSLKATLGIAEQFGEMREIKNRLARRIGELEGLQALARELSRRRDGTSILVGLAEAALSVPGARAASVLTRTAELIPLTSAVLRGLERDPLLEDGGPDSPAGEILKGGEAVALDTLPLVGSSADSEAGRLCSALAVPLWPSAKPSGLLIVYGETPFTPEDLRFLGLLGAHAAVCLDNAAMTERLTRYNEKLEKEVKARTAQIEKANEELRELDRMKDRFLSSVSHEMKTPLTGILSGTELLSTLIPEEDPSREFLTMIDHEGRRLAGLVDRIIRFHVLGRSVEVEERTLIRPQDLVVKVVQEVGEKASAREVGIAIDLPEQLPTLEGNVEALILALREVVENAVKFSPPAGIVQVSAREKIVSKTRAVPPADSAGAAPRPGQLPAGSHETIDQLCVVISVRDCGPGIPKEDQARIFERFEQVGDLLTAKPDGLGLGLPIARELARRHGGDLAVHSETGAGCEFHLYLPVPKRTPRQERVGGAVEAAR